MSEQFELLVQNNGFGVNGAALWYTSVFFVKIMLSKAEDWNEYKKHSHRFLKEMAKWQESCLAPMQDEIAKTSPPKILAKILSSDEEEYNVCGTHILLLMSASDFLCCHLRLQRDGNSTHTQSKVHIWLTMMEKTFQSELCKGAPVHIKEKFQAVLKKLDAVEKVKSSNNGLQFFLPEAYIIYIAHLVERKWKDNSDEESFKIWEVSSGALMTKLLCFRDHGLSLMVEEGEIAGITLPYNVLRDQMTVDGMPEQSAPDIMHLHDEVLHVIRTYVQQQMLGGTICMSLEAHEAIKSECESITRNFALANELNKKGWGRFVSS